MAKQKAPAPLVRSDQKLMALGLFAVVLLLGILFLFGPLQKNKSTGMRSVRVEAERIIKTEVMSPSEVTTPDQSFAAEN